MTTIQIFFLAVPATMFIGFTLQLIKGWVMELVCKHERKNSKYSSWVYRK